MKKHEKLIKEALVLSKNDRAKMADALLQSLQKTDPEIEKLWKREVEERIEAYREGEINSVSVQEIIEKYKTK
ncbi:MAG: addiction module protein [Gracilimonas sp.]|jgi:putative addiction module component (TIGR02574 family)|nr:addiction module protein [Gracilimonas sp.]